MSALSLPRGELSRDAHRPTSTIDDLIESPQLDPLDTWLYLFLDRWTRLHPGWWPTQRQIALAMKRSAAVVNRCLARLRQAGFIRQVANPAEGVRGASIVFTLTSPGPSPARIPGPDESQGDLFEQGIGAGRETKPGVSRNKTAGFAEQDGPVSELAPPTPPCIVFGFEEASSASERASLPSETECLEEDRRAIDRLVGRALCLKHVTREEVLEAIREHGIDRVEYALDEGERRKPNPAESWIYIRAILQRLREAEIAEKEFPTSRSGLSAATTPVMQNHNPGEKVQALPPEEAHAAVEFLRSQYRRPHQAPTAAHEKPAAGSHANVPPTPAQELTDAPDESYRVQMSTASAPDDPSAHSVPRASNPLPPDFQASPAFQGTPPNGRSAATRVDDRTSDPHVADRPADGAAERPGDAFRRMARSTPLRC